MKPDEVTDAELLANYREYANKLKEDNIALRNALAAVVTEWNAPAANYAGMLADAMDAARALLAKVDR